MAMVYVSLGTVANADATTAALTAATDLARLGLANRGYRSPVYPTIGMYTDSGEAVTWDVSVSIDGTNYFTPYSYATKLSALAKNVALVIPLAFAKIKCTTHGLDDTKTVYFYLAA